MKRIILFLLLLYSMAIHAQVFQTDPIWGKQYQRGVFVVGLSAPKDTFQIPNINLPNGQPARSYPWMAVIDSSGFSIPWYWNPTQVKWVRGSTSNSSSTQDLQSVTDENDSTTNDINLLNSSLWINDMLNAPVARLFSPSPDNAALMMKGGSNYAFIRPQNMSATTSFYLPNTGHSNDTIATLSDLIGLSGGSDGFEVRDIRFDDATRNVWMNSRALTFRDSSLNHYFSIDLSDMTKGLVMDIESYPDNNKDWGMYAEPASITMWASDNTKHRSGSITFSDSSVRLRASNTLDANPNGYIELSAPKIWLSSFTSDYDKLTVIDANGYLKPIDTININSTSKVLFYGQTLGVSSGFVEINSSNGVLLDVTSINSSNRSHLSTSASGIYSLTEYNAADSSYFLIDQSVDSAMSKTVFKAWRQGGIWKGLSIGADGIQLQNLSSSSDTTNYKPTATDINGNVVRMNYWPGSGGGGGSSSSISFGTNGQIPFMNSGGTDFDYSSHITFDGINLSLNPSTSPVYIGSYSGVGAIAFGGTFTGGYAIRMYGAGNNGGIDFNGGYFAIRDNGNNNVIFYPSSTLIGTPTSIGHTGTPTAFADIKAGTTSIPALRFNSGSLLTTPLSGAFEFDGSHFYGTIGSIRYQLDNTGALNFPYYVSGTIPTGTAAYDLAVDASGNVIGKTPSASAVTSLNVQTTNVGNVGTGEDDLMSYTLPANTLQNNNDWIEIDAHFEAAGNANSKQLVFYFGTFNQTWSASSIPSGADVHVIIKIIRTGSATQKLTWTFVATGNTVLPNDATGAIDLTSSQLIKFTGEAVANNDLVQKEITITKHNAP